ncbi:PepSY domain-containing protein [Streptomyces sp. NPDC059917]|uniref:PepSY domain-containing protein n=1 Tax=Streptomyces sp. NPDC059917 TaxID=3347002 RepID=UPI00364D3D50
MNSRTPIRARRLMAGGLAAGALTLALTACGQGAGAGVDKARAAADPAAATPRAQEAGATARAPQPPEAPQERGGPKASRAQATATAERSVADGKVTGIRLEDDNGSRVWKVDVLTAEPRAHDVKVDATTGALLGGRADRMPDRARPYLQIPLAKLAAADVDRESAAATALSAAGAGFVSELSIQGSEAAPLWRIEVADGAARHAIDIDAKSGAVARHERRTTTGTAGEGSGERTADARREETDRPAQEDVRERSRDFGRDHYDWSEHLPR